VKYLFSAIPGVVFYFAIASFYAFPTQIKNAIVFSNRCVILLKSCTYLCLGAIPTALSISIPKLTFFASTFWQGVVKEFAGDIYRKIKEGMSMLSAFTVVLLVTARAS
jgi:hypothetical protein